MAKCIVCSNTRCKHNYRYSCEAAKLELGSDGSCLTYDERDIYKEAEGFKRDE